MNVEMPRTRNISSTKTTKNPEPVQGEEAATAGVAVDEGLETADSEGMAVVAVDTKFMEAGGVYGFVDKNGKEVIPLIYDHAEEFKDGKAGVKKDGKEFFIDKTGKPVN